MSADRLPNGWEWRRLDEVSRIIRGASPRPKGDPRFYGGPVPRLMVEDVTRDGKFVYPSVDSLTEEGAKRSRPCPVGTLTLVCSGVVGVPSFLAVDACIHDGFIGLVDIKSNASKDFIYHQLQRLQTEFDASATHGGVFTNLTTKGVAAFSFAMPQDLAEQEAIAEALSDADGVIEGVERLIVKKRRIKQGAMQDLLTARRRLPGFSGEWEHRALGAIASFGKGKGLPKSEVLSSGPVQCVHYGSLFREQPTVIRLLDTFSKTFPGATLSHKGDVLMPTSDVTPSGLAVASCIEVGGVLLGGDILVIRPDVSTLDGRFLAASIRQSRDQILELVSGTTVFHIYANDMRSFVVALPTLEEQKAIVAVFQDMDAEIAALEARLDKARMLKEGMMQNLLTGRVRLV